EAASAAVAPESTDSLIEPGHVLAVAGKPLNVENIRRLTLEHEALVRQMPWLDQLKRALAVLGFLATVVGLCGYYVLYREPRLSGDWRRLATLLAYAAATVAVVP